MAAANPAFGVGVPPQSLCLDRVSILLTTARLVPLEGFMQDILFVVEEAEDGSFRASAAAAAIHTEAQVARDSGLSRESLYKALPGERSPSFDTILKVVTALGLKLSASVRGEAEVT